MSKHFTGLFVACDEKLGKGEGVCGTTATFLNEQGDAPYQMERMAEKAGWFLPLSGKDLCPKHHRLEAARWGVKSLHDQLPSLSVPIGKTPKAKAKDLA